MFIHVKTYYPVIEHIRHNDYGCRKPYLHVNYKNNQYAIKHHAEQCKRSAMFEQEIKGVI